MKGETFLSIFKEKVYKCKWKKFQIILIYLEQKHFGSTKPYMTIIYAVCPKMLVHFMPRIYIDMDRTS